jgi:uncharacterized membrane protein
VTSDGLNEHGEPSAGIFLAFVADGRGRHFPHRPLFLLPVVLTIYIVASIAAFMRDQLGPGTVPGDLMTRAGIGIIGQQQDRLAFLLGLLIAVAGIWFLGLLVRIQTQSLLQDGIGKLFARYLLIRLICKPVARVIRLVTARSGRRTALMFVKLASIRLMVRKLCNQTKTLWTDSQVAFEVIDVGTPPIPAGRPVFQTQSMDHEFPEMARS